MCAATVPVGGDALSFIGGVGVKNQSEANQEKTEIKALVWVVVVSKPGQERRARLELERQGFEVYLPMKLAMDKRPGRAGQMMASPFLPRYLFARVSLLLGDWRKIWSTFGVHGLLGAAERPIGVADEVVERIRLAEEDGYIKIGLEADGPKFGKGEAVRFSMGPVDDLEGLFQERVDDKRALILVSCLGRDSRFVVDLRKLRSAGA